MKKTSYLALALALAAIMFLLGSRPAGAPPKTDPAPVLSRAAGDTQGNKGFEEGARAFNAGDDARSADLLMSAARRDPRCLDIMWDARYTKWLPPGSCAEVTSLAAVDPRGDAGPCALYRLGWIQRNQVREREGDLAARKAGRYFWTRTVAEFPESGWTGAAALELIAAGECMTDAGYPDCAAMTIEAYEDWLGRFPESAERDRVARLTAEQYLVLADRLSAPGPWRSDLKAELCRGRALELAGRLAGDQSSLEDAVWARGYIKAIRESGRPWSVVPDSAVSETRRARQRDEGEPDYSFMETRMKVE